jgi:aminoglycoside phosphotransferase (APT) family kinase protein
MKERRVVVGIELVHRLLGTQFPAWSGLAITPVTPAGTDNAIFRLGDDMLIRMPRVDWAVGQVRKEQRWLPVLAPQLPLAVPTPRGSGRPAEGYPWPWSIYDWLTGENATTDRMADPGRVAVTLARFIGSLQSIDGSDGPPPGEHNFWRGVPLIVRDDSTRKTIAELVGVVDVDAATAVWEEALQARPWSRPPVWVHGDLQSGNLLLTGGELAAVIDFGGLGVGDPAVDMIVAWNLFTGQARRAFRESSRVDDDTWARGRGWALSIALAELRYYVNSDPRVADNARRVLAAVLAES